MTREENTICGGRRGARRKTGLNAVRVLIAEAVIRCWRSWLGWGGGGLDRVYETGGQRLLLLVSQTNITSLEIGSCSVRVHSNAQKQLENDTLTTAVWSFDWVIVCQELARLAWMVTVE